VHRHRGKSCSHSRRAGAATVRVYYDGGRGNAVGAVVAPGAEDPRERLGRLLLMRRETRGRGGTGLRPLLLLLLLLLREMMLLLLGHQMLLLL